VKICREICSLTVRRTEFQLLLGLDSLAAECACIFEMNNAEASG
jgi:hypothetical protein